MADVNEFPQEGSAAPLDYWNDYDTSGAQERAPKKLPPRGRYQFQSAPAPVTFDKDRKGNLTALIDPTIIGGEFDQHKFKYVRVNTRQYHGRRASSFGDYLFSAGFGGRIGGSPQEIEEQLKAAATAVAGRSFPADLNYRIYCTGCSTVLAKSYEDLPVVNGERVGYTKCPTCKTVDAETGAEKPKTVFAEPQFYFVIPKKA